MGELMGDVFPYLKMKTITFAVFVVSLIPLLVEVYSSTVIPHSNAIANNFFLILFSFCCKSVVFLRLGSEYENKLGL